MTSENEALDPRLVESEERYRAVIQNASDMIQSVRPDGTFEFVNQAWLDVFGYTEEEVADLVIWDIIHPDSVDHCMEFFMKAVNGEPIAYMEALFKAKDGTPIPVEGNVTSRMIGDTVVATHGFFRDITERLRAQELEVLNVQLEREKQARYLEKMAALGKLSAGLAHELNNPAAAAQRASARLDESLTRRDAAMHELIGLRLEPDQWQSIDALVSRDRSDNGDAHLDPMEMSDLETEVEEWLEEKDIDRAWEVAPALVQAGCSRDSLEQLVQHIPEEALPSAIQWHAETSTVQELTDVLARSSHRISELVSAVKGYTYMDRATDQEINVHDGIENTLIILGHRLKGVTINRAYDTSLPAVQASGNSLNQVWTNILDNAIDATDGKGIITIRTHHESDTAVIELEDNGSGISESDLACIFEPFYTTKPQGQGTGLGLDTVWRIVTEEQGGQVTVESEPGRTVFRISLPLSRSDARIAS